MRINEYHDARASATLHAYFSSLTLFKSCIIPTTATTMDGAERIQAASKFLLQSPPGEINDVLNGTTPSS